MTDLELQEAPDTQQLAQVIPLVVEILPGQASEGLLDTFDPGTYQDLTLRQLCDQTLAREDWSIEEEQIREDIQRQLTGGKLLCKGRGIDGHAMDYALLEETEIGEKYYYIPIRALKPQEGG